MRRGGNRRGFSLLEVMVAVAILALAFTAIFSSEVGAIRVAHRARTTSMATSLARCKMAEIEEFVAREGLPAVEKAETDGCCEDAEIEGYTCDWRIDRVVLPDVTDTGEAFDDDISSSGAAGALASGDPISAIAAGGSLATGGFGPLVLQYAFPVLKPSFEEQVRRATVTIRWREGTAERSFDVVQYLVDDRGMAMRGENIGDLEGVNQAAGDTDDGAGAAPTNAGRSR